MESKKHFPLIFHHHHGVYLDKCPILINENMVIGMKVGNFVEIELHYAIVCITKMEVQKRESVDSSSINYVHQTSFVAQFSSLIMF